MIKEPKKSKPNQSKSERTRERIHNAARSLFAENGYDNTSIRDVAGKAACDPALVMRYFGSKDRLFAAAVDIDLKLPELNGIDPAHRGVALVKHFLEIWEGSDSAPVLTVLLRSAASTEMAAEKLRDIFASQVLPTLSLSDEPDKAIKRAGLISTQLLGLALSRYILKLPPVVGMSHEEITASVGSVIQEYLQS